MTDCGELTERQREILFAVPDESSDPIEYGDVEIVTPGNNPLDDHASIDLDELGEVEALRELRGEQ